MFEDSGVGPTSAPKSGFGAIVLREAPYLLVLALALFGVAYTSFARTPITLYWILLAPLIGVICVVSGWRNAETRQLRIQLVWRQVLHWIAVLAAIELLFVGDVSRMMNTDATSLTTLAVLALGAFTAGVHTSSWRISLVGVMLALGVPAIAWLEQSALLIALGGAVVVGLIAPFIIRGRRAADY
jgi:hypothetical protein